VGMGTSSGRCRNGPRVVSVAEVGVPLTKAVKRMTWYEAAFSKMDLPDVCEWGKKVWVQIEGENKRHQLIVLRGRIGNLLKQKLALLIKLNHLCPLQLRMKLHLQSVSTDPLAIMGESYSRGISIVERGTNVGTHRCTSWSKYCRLQVGFPSKEGCCWEHYMLQGASHCPGILPSSGCQLFRYIRTCCKTRINTYRSRHEIKAAYLNGKLNARISTYFSLPGTTLPTLLAKSATSERPCMA
jgi:hypothetical protein